MSQSSDSPQVHIGRLRLRVPGDNREAGVALARQLEERLAGIPAAAGPLHLGSMQLRIRGTEGMSPQSMADAVADALGRKLQRTRPATSSHA